MPVFGRPPLRQGTVQVLGFPTRTLFTTEPEGAGSPPWCLLGKGRRAVRSDADLGNSEGFNYECRNFWREGGREGGGG